MRPTAKPPALQDGLRLILNALVGSTSMIRAECRRLGTTPGYFVSCVLLSRYFSVNQNQGSRVCSKTETDSPPG
jgi:hypothetical protein